MSKLSDEFERHEIHPYSSLGKICYEHAYAIIAARRARETGASGAVVCGACGEPWTGQKCAQAENGHTHPVCYPYQEPSSATRAAEQMRERAAQAGFRAVNECRENEETDLRSVREIVAAAIRALPIDGEL